MSGTNRSTTDHQPSKRGLFQSAMKNDWKNILKICEKHPIALKEKITRKGDTLLHLAVANGKEDFVRQLVDLITKPGNEATKREALREVNERADTPLHLAASLGNVRMCRWIAEAYPEVIGARNVDGETPLFLAVAHGKLKAFLCLHYICQEKGAYEHSYARRNSGETILHSAISGDYFELALIIIHLYKDLVDSMSEEGKSALHLLASKPSAFKSGSHLRSYDSIIYYCTIVEELNVNANKYQHQQIMNSISDKTRSSSPRNYPENYNTCISFYNIIVRVLVGKKKKDQENNKQPDAEKGQEGVDPPKEKKPGNGARGHELYRICYVAIKVIFKAMLIILGLGQARIVKLREKKQKHTLAVQIMNELVGNTHIYEYEDSGGNPWDASAVKNDETTPYMLEEPFDFESNQNVGGDHIYVDDKNKQGTTKGAIKGKAVESPLLIAARNGVMEMVEKILEYFPVAISDTNSDNKNILLVAVESRQPHIYQFLLDREDMKDIVFSKVDKDSNNALHLAATLDDNYTPWLIPGAALQMQWEIKWYEFVKNTVPQHMIHRYNNGDETPKDVFTRTHSKLVTEGGEWLTKTSNSCSVVAALIATVAFATSTNVPGGNNTKGTPRLENDPAFDLFAISSLVALCVSVTALVMFLSVLTSRYQEKDFKKYLPWRLLTGLSSLFISIAAMLISFCAGHFFVLKDKFRYHVIPIYAVTCLPITFFAIAQFQLYFDLIRATFKKVPQRRYKMVLEKPEDVKKYNPESKFIDDWKYLIGEGRPNLKTLFTKANRVVDILLEKMGGDQMGEKLGDR